MSYLIPANKQRTELEVARSRFITTVEFVDSVELARQFIGDIRIQMPGASHHVYAYRVGYGNTVIEGMSDDGEPTGTSGPPTLAVLRGYDIGDIVLVTTRYFGGTKLGTGGLVRAYTEAAHIALNSLETIEKIATYSIGIEVSYSLYKMARNLVLDHEGHIEDETFSVDVTILATIPVAQFDALSTALRNLSSGKIQPLIIS